MDLPQIIVIGDQSSGKSSVIEAISRVRFPTKADGICTRFATELVLRTAPQSKFSVTVVSSSDSSAASPVTRQLPLDETAFTGNWLPKIIERAHTAVRLIGSQSEKR